MLALAPGGGDPLQGLHRRPHELELGPHVDPLHVDLLGDATLAVRPRGTALESHAVDRLVLLASLRLLLHELADDIAILVINGRGLEREKPGKTGPVPHSPR